MASRTEAPIYATEEVRDELKARVQASDKRTYDGYLRKWLGLEPHPDEPEEPSYTTRVLTRLQHADEPRTGDELTESDENRNAIGSAITRLYRRGDIERQERPEDAPEIGRTPYEYWVPVTEAEP